MAFSTFASFNSQSSKSKPPFNGTSSPFTLNKDSISGLQLWLDASDPNNNGVVPGDGSSLTTWYDKSGGNRNATANGSITYHTSGLKSGYPALVFSSGTPRWLTGSVSITSTGASVFVVGYHTSYSSAYFRFIGFSNGNGVNDFSNTGFFGFLRQSSTGVGPYRNGTYPVNNTASYSTPSLFECWFDGTNAYNTVQVSNNTKITSSASTGTFGITYYTVGANPNTADVHYLDGRLSEIMVFNRALTSAERQDVEGYLSWKWGLQKYLPSSHLYSPISIPLFTIYARYRASDYNTATNIWNDSTGNGRHIPSSQITNTGLTKVTTTANTNGATKSFVTLQGTTSSKIIFTTATITNYTLFTVARYVGTNTQRIFASSAVNWLDGFHAGNTGVSHYDTWVTESSNTITGNNWLLSTSSGSQYRGNGICYNINYSGITYLPELSINNHFIGSAQFSDFQVVDVLIFDSYLSEANIIIVETYLSNLYGITIGGLAKVGGAAVQLSSTAGYNSTHGTLSSVFTSNSSFYIWNIANAHADAPGNIFIWFYYKFYYTGSATTATVYGVCDDYAYVYVNGNSVGEISGGWGANSSGSSYSTSLSYGWNYIRLPAYNGGGPAGLIFAMYASDGVFLAGTDSNWRCLTNSGSTTLNYSAKTSDPLNNVVL